MRARRLPAQVMMLEIAQHVQAFLHSHDHPPISLHEEMVRRQRKEEEEEKRRLFLKEEAQRLKMEEEVRREGRREGGKEGGRERGVIISDYVVILRSATSRQNYRERRKN